MLKFSWLLLNQLLFLTLVSSSRTFEKLANILLRSDKKDLDDYTDKEIVNAIQSLASSQATLKSMDGLSHQFLNTFSDKSSLQSRYDKFMSGSQTNKKEAAKIFEYVLTVERSLQAIEILDAIQYPLNDRIKVLQQAGVEELQQYRIQINNMKCIMSIMIPKNDSFFHKSELHQSNVSSMVEPSLNMTSSKSKRYNEPKFHTGEMIIAITDYRDDLHYSRHQTKAKKSKQKRKSKLSDEDEDDEGDELLLSLFTKKHDTISLQSKGLVEEEITIQPDLIQLTNQALSYLEDYLLPSSSSNSRDIVKPDTVSSLMKNKSSRKLFTEVNHFIEESSSVSTEAVIKNEGTFANTKNCQNSIEILSNYSIVTKSGIRQPLRIRLMGYSAGGAVSAYLAMILEGSLNTSSPLLSNSMPFVGLYKNYVQCLTLGSPPCVSRSVIPQYISTIICGDDMIPRSSYESLQNFKQRVHSALKSGAGTNSLRWVAGAGWLKDLSQVASKGLSQYSTGAHDLSSLSVPGRAFFIKSRAHKNVCNMTIIDAYFFDGASLQRVLRGNWKEDALWLLHEVMISKRMLKHHSLLSYFKTLQRC